MKILVGLTFILIVGALAYAGMAMLRGGREDGKRKRTMMHALAFRVALSVLLFVCILVSYKMGWIRPTGVPLAR
jgi:xanthine/uracil permease